MLHSQLSQEKWQNLPFFNQMANVGAEIGRAINWRSKNQDVSRGAFERGLELLDLTIDDFKNRKYLKELCRLREVLADYFYFDNEHGLDDKNMNNYFYGFNYASSINAKI